MVTRSISSRPVRYTLSIAAVALGSVALYKGAPALFSERFQPHRVCYLERPDLIWANVVTDAIIFVSYVVIFSSLMWVVARSRDLLNATMVTFLTAFGTFILACGMTHLMETIVIWYPFYWLAVGVKVITAIASAATAVALAMKKGLLLDGVSLYRRQLETSETERRLAVEALLTTDKLAMIGRLSASISHEINNPIDAVMNVVYCARIHPGLPEDLKDLLDSADKELKHVIEIAHSTLAVYRDTIAPAEVDLEDVVHDSLDLLRMNAIDRSITLTAEVEEDPVIEAYGGEVRQVVINLVRNAIEASKRGGEVRVSVRQAMDDSIASKGYLLIVEDDGSGISADFLPNLFRPSTSTKENGNGIGLWIVRQIIEKHGGTIAVESSTHAPSGTKFTVWLPLLFASGTLQGAAMPLGGAEAVAR
jgi:signal transduction histidine kinase